MSTPDRAKTHPSRCNPATTIFLNDMGGLAGVERVPCAALRPHSSVPLVGAVGGVTWGGNCADLTSSVTRGVTHRLGQKNKDTVVDGPWRRRRAPLLQVNARRPGCV